MGKKAAGFLAVIGWAAVVLQFVLSMTAVIEPEPSMAERIVRFFSYFTVLTNIIVAATLSAIAFFPESSIGRFFGRPSVQAAVASYIAVVGIVYSLFLRSVWDPVGWQAVADHALHDAMPLLYVIYWVMFSRKDGIRITDPIKWLSYPFAYFVYSLARGAIVNWYPYWFADVTQLGYATALTNAGMVLVFFFIIGMIFYGLAKLLARPAAAVAA